MIIDDDRNLAELLHFQLLARLGDLALLIDDPAQSGFIPVLEVDLLAVRRDLHDPLDVLLNGPPAVIDVDVETYRMDKEGARHVLCSNMPWVRCNFMMMAASCHFSEYS